MKRFALCGVCLALSWPARAAGQEQRRHAPPERAADTRGSQAADAQVVVRGERRRSVSSRDRTAASTVIGREAFEAPATSAADVIARAPGVQITQSGGGADLATASVRGASSAQTPVYLAGIRINDDVTGTADLSQVPLFMLDRIEIFRGNAPAEADRLGIGGAIFFEPRLPARTELGGSAEVASFGRLSTSLGAGAAEGGEGSLVGVSRTVAEDDYPYVDDRGTRFVRSDDRVLRRPNADSTAFDSWAIGRFWLGPGGGRATSVLNAYEREQGVTGLGVDPARAARGRTRRLLGGLDTKLPCSRQGADVCELELVTSGIVTESELTDPLAELDAAPGVTSSRGRRVTLGMRTRHRLSERSSVGLGVSEEIERLGIDRTAAAPLRAASSMTRLSATFGFPLAERLELGLLGALARQTSSSVDERASVLEPAGRLGLRFEATRELELVSNLGRYLRLPTLGELYGVAPLVRGNPELEPELGLSADLGLRARLEASGLELFVDGFVFGRSVSELVGYRRSELGYVRPYNVGRARLLGAELASRAILLNHVQSELALTLLDPRDTSEDRQTVNDILPHQSRMVATAGLEVFGALAGLDRAGLLARVRYRSSRYADSAGLIVIPEELLLDLEASLHFWERRAALRFTVENVFDREHFDLIGFPQPARRFAAGAELWWW